MWLEKHAKGSAQARSMLIEHNLRLVVYIAKRFENTPVTLEDLISIGTIGLIKAVNTICYGPQNKAGHLCFKVHRKRDTHVSAPQQPQPLRGFL